MQEKRYGNIVRSVADDTTPTSQRYHRTVVRKLEGYSQRFEAKHITNNKMSERLVPVLHRDWGFFDRQRSLFSEQHKDVDDEFKQFEIELEQMKRDMFTLTPMDFGSMGDMGLDFDMDMPSMGSMSDKMALDMKMDSSRKMESSMKQTTTKKTTTKTTTSSTSTTGSLTGGSATPVSDVGLGMGGDLSNAIMLKVDRPFITDIQGNKKLTLRFDVSQFKPEEITVKTINKTLTVHAKHVEESPGKKVYREFTKTYSLPKPVDPLLLTSTLSKDGVLHIEAPTPDAIEAPREFLIPITMM